MFGFKGLGISFKVNIQELGLDLSFRFTFRF